MNRTFSAPKQWGKDATHDETYAHFGYEVKHESVPAPAAGRTMAKPSCRICGRCQRFWSNSPTRKRESESYLTTTRTSQERYFKFGAWKR